MASESGSDIQLRAAQACLSCRKQKRKCDKALPSCSLCQRMARPCDYSDNTPAPNADDFALLRQKVTELESRLDQKSSPNLTNGSNGKNGIFTPESLSPGATMTFVGPTGTRSTFPALFFLDSEVYADARLSIPRPSVAIPQEVLLAIGSLTDVNTLAEIYFSTIHVWLPIVSKKRLQLTLSAPNLEPGADLALLLLSMKLATQQVSNGPFSAQTALYWTAKSFFGLLESSAMMSIQLIQSALLIAAYEIGHAIYPAAYLTTGQCARIGYALGIHRRQYAPQVIMKPGAWAEIEEMCRVWWGVMLMDRYVNLGGNDRPLATEAPLRTHVLPADDSLWDLGELTTSEPLYVSSPTSVTAGAFARTCQATHLLGRLIHFLNDRQEEPSIRFSEAIQIHRTLTALSNLLAIEVGKSPAHFGTSMSLCYAALLHLCDRFSCTATNRGEHTVEETNMQKIAIAGLKNTSAEAFVFSQLLNLTMTNNIAAASPLTADCIYQTAGQFAWLVHETGEAQMITSYHALVDTLILMSARWAVAGEYLKALDTARETLYGGNALLERPLQHSA